MEQELVMTTTCDTTSEDFLETVLQNLRPMQLATGIKFKKKCMSCKTYFPVYHCSERKCMNCKTT